MLEIQAQNKVLKRCGLPI
uniref:Uncharacterized protein n=1 Tax=Rhizophora mucronata TaxID=61149 RepID=A0A2P2QZ54_RHIMU